MTRPASKDNGAVHEGLKSRQSALALLTKILGQKRPLDQILDREDTFLSLDDRDRSFVRMLVATALRRKGQMDDLISRAMEHGKAPQPETLKYILYIGMTQLFFMDVSDHAAVDLSVRLAEDQGMVKQKAFVNAVLRRMSTEGREWEKDQNPLALNIPDWILQQWINDYGEKEAADIAQASLAEASLDITLKDPDDADHWAQALEASILPTGSLRRAGGVNVRHLHGYKEGAWWVQDAAAAMPVKLFDDVQGRHIVDMCAAPGGKTAQLAAMGARVTAVDRSASRMKILQENMARLGFEKWVEVMISDGADWRPKEPVDGVLIDAPCTATGTIRRHPDLLHLKTPKDLEALVSVQARLLDNAALMIAPGGILIYSTCSLQKAEGEDQIEAFLDRHPEFQRVPIHTGDIDGVAGPVTEKGDVRILPYHLATHGGMDGFFIARLGRV